MEARINCTNYNGVSEEMRLEINSEGTLFLYVGGVHQATVNKKFIPFIISLLKCFEG